MFFKVVKIKKKRAEVEKCGSFMAAFPQHFFFFLLVQVRTTMHIFTSHFDQIRLNFTNNVVTWLRRRCIINVKSGQRLAFDVPFL